MMQLLHFDYRLQYADLCGIKWKVNGKCSDCMSEGVDLGFAVKVDDGCV